jgi:pSer/pThr/pTyr-binding forkhead associated (FHA) protein
MAWVVVDDKQKGVLAQTFELIDGKNTVGRNSHDAVNLYGSLVVSRKHAVIHMHSKEEVFFIIDCDSSNGTKVRRSTGCPRRRIVATARRSFAWP